MISYSIKILGPSVSLKWILYYFHGNSWQLCSISIPILIYLGKRPICAETSISNLFVRFTLFLIYSRQDTSHHENCAKYDIII